MNWATVHRAYSELCQASRIKVLEEAVTQPARNIPGIFSECSLSVAMFRASRETLVHILKENIFYEILNGYVVFVYD